MRLKDALAEIKRLKAMEDEVNSLKTGLKIGGNYIGIIRHLLYISCPKYECGEESAGRRKQENAQVHEAVGNISRWIEYEFNRYCQQF